MSLVFTNCEVVGDVSVLDGCCCEHTCLLENQFAYDVDILSIVNSTSGGGANSNVVIEIGGVAFTPPSGAPLPYILGMGLSVEIKWKSCGQNPPSFTNDTTTVTFSDPSGVVGTQVKTMRIVPVSVCDMVTIDGSPYPATIDFGFVVAGTSQDVIIDIENPTNCEWQIDYNDDCADPQLTYNQPNPFVIPAYTTMSLIATWSPIGGSVGSLACNIAIHVLAIADECNTSCNLSITGISGALPCLTCDDIEYSTENDYLDLVSNLCTITPLSFIHGAIGEKKSMSFSMNYGNGLQTGVKLYFNPMLFSYDCDWLQYYASGVINDPMPTSWFIEYVAGMPVISPMNIVNAGSNTENNRNYEVEFHNINPPYEFMIRIIYYNICDMDEPLNSTTKINNPKLLLNTRYNGTYFDNSDACVYNQMKKWCAMTYLIDPNFQAPDPLTEIIGDFECYHLDSIPITQRFYNTGLLNAPAEMTNHLFTVERNGTPQLNFSTINETDVTFKIEHTSVPTQLVIWLIDWNNFDDTVTFYENYNSSRSPIDTNVLPVVLDNSISAPSTALTNVGINTYEGTFKVNTSVTSGGKYYIIAVVYDKVNDIVNSFVSKQFGVIEIPDDSVCCDMAFTPVFSNYFTTTFSEYWQPCVKERFRYELTMSPSDLETCIDDWGGVGADWNQYCTKIEFKVQEENIAFPTANDTTYVIYDKGTLTRQNGTPTGWTSNNASLSNTEAVIVGTTFMQVEYNERRVRWEDQAIPSLAEVETTGDPSTRISAGAMSSTYISTLGSTYNWANKDVYFETNLFFDFTSLFGQPFQMVIKYKSKMKPLGVGELNGSGNGLDEIKFFKEDKITEIGEVFCLEDLTCLWVRTHKNFLGVARAFALISPVQSSIGNIEEEDGMYSTLVEPMQNLMTDKLCSVDNEFDGSDHAWFSVDISKLNAGQWEVCGYGNGNNGAIVPVPNVDVGCPCVIPEPTFDPDAQAYIDALISAGVPLSASEEIIVNDLVVSLKSAGLWIKLQALYPFMGSSATSHKFNLANPLDTDVAFRLSFSGGWIHSVTGAKPNGVNGYADTFFNPHSNLASFSDSHYSVYSRDNTLIDLGIIIGAYDPTVDQTIIRPAYPSQCFWDGRYSPATGKISATLSNTLSLIMMSRESSTLLTGYHVTSSVGTSTTTMATSMDEEIYLSARNSAGIPSAYSGRELAFASIGSSMTSGEQSDFYNAIQTFQTSLSRQV